ncbi:hypothetical protein [Peribacillus sp. SCS-155]|uniref:hypothetical protein n=1 Tax=Peribacillus sedimenti TaxID=3115297 RepID=UPI0039062975
MDINQYYQKTAAAFFQVSWIALMLAVLFFVLHAADLLPGNIIAITAPFILLSIINMIGSRIYSNRSVEVIVKEDNTGIQLFEQKDILLAFMPAPTLRLLLFNPDGTFLGEIRDKNMKWFKWMIPNSLSFFLRKHYLLLNASGEKLGEYYMKRGLQAVIHIKNGDGETVGHYEEILKDSLMKIKGMVFDRRGEPWIPVQIKRLSEFSLATATQKQLAVYQKGWMPQDWQQRFKDPNTPILTFHENADSKEKLAVFAVCAALFNHRSN